MIKDKTNQLHTNQIKNKKKVVFVSRQEYKYIKIIYKF